MIEGRKDQLEGRTSSRKGSIGSSDRHGSLIVPSLKSKTAINKSLKQVLMKSKKEFKLGEIIHQSKKKLGIMHEVEFTKHYQKFEPALNKVSTFVNSNSSGGSDETVKPSLH